jgi:hypothetical protein
MLQAAPPHSRLEKNDIQTSVVSRFCAFHPPSVLSAACEPLQPPWAPPRLASRPASGSGKARQVEMEAHPECAAREAAGSPVQLPSLAASGQFRGPPGGCGYVRPLTIA